ncbi:MAG: hypothetical protein QOG64_2888, partial [Acidimicrobiaceae bacterium]|nr:hypothetical protein [Acidimicrobiaceae bacterium]
AAELERTAVRLAEQRGQLQAVLDAVGVTSNVPSGIATVEAWLAGQATDSRRRAAAVEPVVHHRITPPEFHRDRWTGLHLHGYTVFGLDYRHLGRETRAVTDTYDYPGGWTKTVRQDQNRHVYQVAFGIGMGNIVLGEGDPQRCHDGWKTTGTTTTYAHGADAESEADFRRATGSP